MDALIQWLADMHGELANLWESWRAPACAVDGKVYSRVMKFFKNVLLKLQQIIRAKILLIDIMLCARAAPLPCM